jgi:hypothetical protein
MALSYVDFVAKNVEVCVKYYVNKEAHWYKGKVIKVVDRFLDDEMDECVKCLVQYDDERYTDVFCERDYNTDDENAWSFGKRFVALVENVMRIVDDFDETEEEESDIDNLETTTSSSITSIDSDTDTDIDTEQEEPKLIQEKKRYSVMNNVGATLFMLAPWIASGIALFNARKEICQAMKNY